jgi:perosamine synthetase
LSELKELALGEVVAAIATVLGDHPRPIPLHEPELDQRDLAQVASCLAEGWVSTASPGVACFEDELARATGAAHAVATVNGTAALHTALLLSGVRPGDEVLVPALTFAGTINAIAYCGATPHFVEVEPGTLGVDPDALARHLARIAAPAADGGAIHRASGRCLRAVVPVHVFGHPVRMAPLGEVAARFGLAVIEDAAQALGSRAEGRPVGADSRLAVFSFNGNKIVTAGGGGALVTADGELARRARHLTTTARRPHPWEVVHDSVGYNYRLPGLNAALGRAQLARLDDMVERKRLLAERYRDALAGIPGVTVVHEPPGTRSNYWLSALLLDTAQRRDELLAEITAAGILARAAWTPAHRLPMYAACPRMDLSLTETLAARLVTLPSSPALASARGGAAR